MAVLGLGAMLCVSTGCCESFSCCQARGQFSILISFNGIFVIRSSFPPLEPRLFASRNGTEPGQFPFLPNFGGAEPDRRRRWLFLVSFQPEMVAFLSDRVFSTLPRVLSCSPAASVLTSGSELRVWGLRLPKLLFLAAPASIW